VLLVNELDYCKGKDGEVVDQYIQTLQNAYQNIYIKIYYNL